MSLKPNLLHYLLPNSRLPPDVNFTISSSTTPVSIMAHKCFLADASHVFDNMFFLSGTARVKLGLETVEVKNVSVETFRKFVEHIYGKELVIEEVSSLLSMFELLLLVDQYDMVELKVKLVKRIKSNKVEKENLPSVMNILEKFEGNNESRIILENVVSRYMKTNLGALDNLSTFMSEHKWLDRKTLVYLLTLMNNGEKGGRSIKQGGDQAIDAKTCETREVVTDFLRYSEFPNDGVKEMVDKFIKFREDNVGECLCWTCTE